MGRGDLRATGRPADLLAFREWGAQPLHISYEPDGALEKIADSLGVVSARVEGDLQRFKEFIEEKGASAGWRDEIHGKHVAPPSEF
jgi:hypothetical protein